MSKTVYFRDFFRFRARRVGNTHTLIQGMLQSPNSVMFVTSQAYAHALSRQYGIPEHRFISVGSGLRNLEGRQFNAPIVVDLPAIATLFDQAEAEHAQEMETNTRKIAALQKKIVELEESRHTLQAIILDACDFIETLAAL